MTTITKVTPAKVTMELTHTQMRMLEEALQQGSTRVCELVFNPGVDAEDADWYGDVYTFAERLSKACANTRIEYGYINNNELQEQIP